MSTSGSSDFVSAAEAKLRRQQQRIDMDAALFAPPAHSSHRPTSRGKDAKVKMPIDWNIAEQHSSHLEPPAAEVRVNTFYQHHPSRAPSLSRSMSGLSEQTSSTDLVRRDSRMDPGFQLYQRGRTRKHEELTPFEDKPEQKQKTVEASFDKREIYQVFAGELPNLDFIHANPGIKSGQLQFIQHPNGDVSAHMWSSVRYEWENIGSFSNIRKRIEGQVAHDRLRGETAGQALQRNTLAYFRTIAKQKEQTTMGYTFGQAEIQDLMPLSKDQQSSTGTKKEDENSHTGTSSRVTSSSTAPTHAEPVVQVASQLSRSADQEHSHYPLHQRSILSEKLRSLVSQQAEAPLESTMRSSQQFPSKADDPFTSAASLRTSDAPSSVVSTVPSRSVLSRGGVSSTTVAATSSSTKSGSLVSMPLFTSGSTTHHDSTGRVTSGGIPGVLPAHSHRTASSEKPAIPRDVSISSLGTPSRTKPATPFASREAMRDQLFKLGETAKERSLSQANIRTERTVMHDPFLGQSHANESETFPAYTESSNAVNSPAMSFRTAFDRTYEVGSPGLMRKEPKASLRGWKYSQPPIPRSLAHQTRLRRECSVGDSVPDTDNQYSRVTPHMYESGLAKPYPGTNKKSEKEVEQELRDWWYSGNKVLRQEEFYRSIVTASKNATTTPARTHLRTPSIRPRPIGTPALNSTTEILPTPGSTASTTLDTTHNAPLNTSLTRILIPVYENLASYVQGPLEKRRDYWCQWTQPPEYAIDHSPNGNNSFFEEEWGKPPARIGRDPRYARLPPPGVGDLRFGGYSPGMSGAIGNSPMSAGGGGAALVLSGGVSGLGAGRYTYYGGYASGGMYQFES